MLALWLSSNIKLGRGSRREEERVLCGNGKGKAENESSDQGSAVEKHLVWPLFELKDELVVCYRHECLRVPAGATSQLGLSVLTRPPSDQRLWRVQTRSQLFPPGSQLQQDSRIGRAGLLSQLQLSQQLPSAAAQRGETSTKFPYMSFSGCLMWCFVLTNMHYGGHVPHG